MEVQESAAELVHPAHTDIDVFVTDTRLMRDIQTMAGGTPQIDMPASLPPGWKETLRQFLLRYDPAHGKIAAVSNRQK